MKLHLFIIGLGGALGSIGRYGVQILMKKYWDSPFPMGTFVVNLLGCFLIGLFYSFTHKYLEMNEDWKLFLIVGICGGFTTFSSYSYENLILLREGHYLYFFGYALLSMVLGLLAVVCGLQIFKSI